MANVVIMPKQGQSVESCIVTEFIKKVGDKVAVGDVLFSYETDKATFEEESQVEGTVLACFFADGDEIPCLTNVMVIGTPGESFEEFAPKTGGTAAETIAQSEASPKVKAEETSDVVSFAAGPVVEGAPVSPRARKLAAEKGVSTSMLAGSGPHGRIIERDVQAAIAAGNVLTGKARALMAEGGWEAPASGSGLNGAVKAGDLKVVEARSKVKASYTDISGEGTDFEVVKMSNMRKLIARSMYNSLQNSAQLTHHLGADARRLQALRKKAKKAYEEGRIATNVTINDLVCYAVVKALQQFPNANSHCLGESMRIFKKVHLGLAVDTERGLMVPAVKNADELDIIGLSQALKKVAEECKKGGINPDLLSPEAASFTVSNLGNYGVEIFTPIINVPQSAILGVNTIVLRPKDLGGGVYDFVPYIGLSLTYDHRSLDGGEATRFVKQIATEIENLDLDF
jgi:pyruvate dehydrogenase E2 component (dihydrolipoamide acetyltransferase)